jgi:hypothetical protein
MLHAKVALLVVAALVVWHMRRRRPALLGGAVFSESRAIPRLGGRSDISGAAQRAPRAWRRIHDDAVGPVAASSRLRATGTASTTPAARDVVVISAPGAGRPTGEARYEQPED